MSRKLESLTSPSAIDGDLTFRDLADNLPTLCWVANADGHITWYNRRWHDYCGTTAEQMEGWGWQAVHDPDVLPAVMERWTGSIATGEPFEMVFPLRGADGVFRPFLSRIVPQRDEAGVLRRWVGNNVDISAQVAVEDELRRSREELERVNRAIAEREAFLSSVLSSSTDCIKVLDLAGNLTFMNDGGQQLMEIGDFADVAGRPWTDVWHGAGRESAKRAVEAARRGDATTFMGMAETRRGNLKWWHVAVSPITGPDGKPERILCVSRDITELRASGEERDRFVRLAENSTDFIGMAARDGRVFYLNGAARRLVGLEDRATSDLVIGDFFSPEQAEQISREVLPAVDRVGQWAGEVELRHFGTGEAIPVLYSVFRITDANGMHVAYGTVTRDFRERRRAEDDMRLLNGELAHRLKNVLAVVQSVASQTLRSASDTEAASRDLSARLVALGAATDLLTRRSWRSADLGELAVRALTPHGAIGTRILIDGPRIAIKPQVTVAFALTLHELATNAAKYGALSNETGTVSLRWGIADQGGEALLDVHWREHGGPPVQAPQRKGFGSVLIERSLSAYTSGKTEAAFDAEGFTFTLHARLEDVSINDGNN